MSITKNFCHKRIQEILDTPGPMNAIAQGAIGAFREVIEFQQSSESFEDLLLNFKKEQFKLYEDGQGFDWDDISKTIEKTAKYFYNLKNENI